MQIFQIIRIIIETNHCFNYHAKSCKKLSFRIKSNFPADNKQTEFENFKEEDLFLKEKN